MPFLITLIVLVVLCGAYLFLIKPRKEPKTSVQPLKVDYAHRGLWGDDVVENTMPAFYNAFRAGFGIELDVRLSSDEQVVVFHDDTLERLCGREDRVDSLTASELSWVNINGCYERIPLFSEVLDRIDHKTPLCIELKGSDTRLCEKVAELLDHYDGYFSVESFNPFLLNWFRVNRPRYVRGQLVTNMWKIKKSSIASKLFATPMLLNCLSRPDYISYDIRSKNLSVWLCDKLFHSLMFAWTVKTPAEYSELKAQGRIVIFQDFRPDKR